MPDIKSIKRNTNNFSLTETIASLVNNKAYRSGYDDLKNGKTNDRTYFWTCLSAVGEEVGEVIYENVLNYINNVANINTCKLRALTSIAKVLGIREFSVLKNLNAVPNDVLNMMDIFSINRSYLLNPRYFNTDFVKDLLYSTLDEEAIEQVQNNPDLAATEDISAYNIIGSISNEKYTQYVEEVFFKILASKVFQNYGSLSGDFIYTNLLNENNGFSLDNSLAALRADSEVANSTYNIYSLNNNDAALSSRLATAETNYSKTLYRYKKAFNVKPGFDEKQIVDNIENGLDFLDNYQGGELSVLQLEINERAKPKYSKNSGYAYNRLDTRYSYYNEIEVKQYVKFVDDLYLLNQTNLQYAAWNPLVLSNNFSPYFLDNNYSNITLSSNVALSSNIANQQLSVSEILGYDVPFSSFVYDYYGNSDFVFSPEIEDDRLSAIASQNILRMVAKILTDICFAVVDIREKLKTQAQRNYMTGTKLLIEYILDEYLANSLIHNYGADPSIVLSSGVFGTKIVEYMDSTEYYNIGLLSDESGFAKSSVNPPFFSDLSNGGQNATATGVGLVADEIRDFYLSTLNIKSNYLSSVEDYYDFMSAVYEVGISKTYVGNDGALVFDKEGLSNMLSIELDIAKLCVENNLTDKDYEYLKRNEFIKSLEGYLQLNYDVLSNYWNLLSAEAEVVSSQLEIYNSKLSAYIKQQTELALKYHGMDVAYYPWYNYKNQDFPTFQSHPYLYNFIEHNDESYPIENAFYGNANADLIYELQSENLSVYLSSYGNIRRVWRNSIFDYSGYKSRYENSTHSYGVSNSNGLYSVTHYDGLFYPPAIDLYKKYYRNEIFDGELSGFDLLSAHMTLCVDNDCYHESNLDIPEISSMWHYYSHLGLTYADRQRIVDQLLKLSNDILEMADANFRSEKSDIGNVEEPYDIYKYGLDYNKNSIILVKRYLDDNGNIRDNDKVSYRDKRETLGQLWIRFNSHPIAFPAFLKGTLSSYQQVSFENQNARSSNLRSLNGLIIHNVREEGITSEFGSKKSLANVYDFDLTQSGRYLVYAVENPSENVSDKSYKNSVAFAAAIYQSRSVDYFNPANEKTTYQLLTNGPKFLYPTNDGPFKGFNQTSLENLSASDYEFDGFFQNNRQIYAGYFKRLIDNDILSGVATNVIEYPGEIVQGNNLDSFQFAYSNSFVSTPLNNDCAVTYSDAKIKLGYSDEKFALVITSEIKDDDLVIQDFIGKNSVSKKEGYGKTNLFEATKNDDPKKYYNSFDRFTELVSIHEFTGESTSTSFPRTTIYALNSDASYVPLYYGVQGQNLYYNLKWENRPASYNKEWHRQDEISNDFVSKQSMELLGYTFQDIDKWKKQIETTIYEDKYTGKYTNIKGNDLLETSLRVYEDFELSDYILEKYNKGGVFYADLSGNFNKITIKFENIKLPGLMDDPASYNLLLLNASNGKDKSPILAGPFVPETFNTPNYDTTSTNTERNLLSIGLLSSFNVRVVGTPNPFSLSDTTLNEEYSNHIFCIEGLSTNLRENVDSYTLELDLYPRSDLSDFGLSSFAVQSNSLVLFVYKNTLGEFQKFHYMEPFPRFPFNASMSVWNQPWKDKRYPWLYPDGYDAARDAWLSGVDVSAYSDVRNQTKNYREYLLANGINVSAVVGHLSSDKYDETRWNVDPTKISTDISQLSIMENINVDVLHSLSDNYWLSTGQITWKISEEDEFDQFASQYPPMVIDYFLYEKFGSTNKSRVVYNLFDLSNTFIFQLEDPLSIANKIGKIAIPYGTTASEYNIVYEDYLSSMINVDIGGENAYHYFEMLFDPKNTIEASASNFIGQLSVEDFNGIAIDTSGQEDPDAYIERFLSSHFVYPEETDRSTNFILNDYYIMDVKPEDIAEYLKLYVCWRKVKFDDPNRKDEIELYFNFQNLFSSPYSFRTKHGHYAVEFKPNTYLKLGSGEDGYLYIILQFKYFDSNGDICGLRDLPILTYHIFNVSDDKPKFILTKTFEIDNFNDDFTYSNDNDEENNVYLILENKTYDSSDIVNSSRGKISVDQAFGWDFRSDCDLYLKTNLQVMSLTPLSTLNLEMVYDPGKQINSYGDNDPEMVFDSSRMKYGSFVDNYGILSGSFSNMRSSYDLPFNLLNGTYIDDTTGNRSFPIEIINADGVDIHGNKPNFIFVNGGISLNEISAGLYLARELSSLPISRNRFENLGYILEEQNGAFIRMYNRRHESDLPLLTEKNQYILTEGENADNSSYNDLPLLCED